MTGEERLDIALTGIPDDIAPDLEAKRGAWNVCSYVLVKMLDGLGDLAPNRFTYVFSYDDSERYEISVHRVRGESQLAALEKSNAALEQALEAVDRLTAERDELAATLANDRGEGVPPTPGWKYDAGEWVHPDATVSPVVATALGGSVRRRWEWGTADKAGQCDTARAAMRAAGHAISERGSR